MLRESNFEDGKTFIKGFLERSMALSLDKFTELEVIVDDDEGWDWVTIIFAIAVAAGLSVVGVELRDPSGDGDLVRQFFNHKSGVIRLSTSKVKAN